MEPDRWQPPSAPGDNGKILCIGKGALGASLDATWRSPNNRGVSIRLLWSDISALQREMEQAVKQGQLFSLGIKAGNEGTPDCIATFDLGHLWGETAVCIDSNDICLSLCPKASVNAQSQ